MSVSESPRKFVELVSEPYKGQTLTKINDRNNPSGEPIVLWQKTLPSVNYTSDGPKTVIEEAFVYAVTGFKTR